MKQEREVQAQLCGEGSTQRVHLGCVPVLCPSKPHPNSVPPLKDNWLTKLPHHTNHVPNPCNCHFLVIKLSIMLIMSENTCYVG